MSEWQEVKLSDISDIIAGYAFKGNDFSDDGDELVIKIKDIQEPFVDTNGATKVLFKNYSEKKLEKFLVKKGDFVIAMTGATIGKIGRYVDSGYAYINQRVAKFEAKKGTDKDFLYFVTQHPNFKTHILNNIDSQSAQGNISATSIGRYSFYFPSLPEQNEIAQILKSIDHKIELNQRMNETLEGMARAIFKSWFVDFDPVHAKAEGRTPEGMDSTTAALFPDSLTDDGLPEGWIIEGIGENFEIFDNKRIPLSSRERENRKGTYPYYGATSIMDYIDDFIFEGVHVLIGEDGSVVKEDGTPFMQYVWGKFWVNNHAHVLKGLNPVCDEHIYLHLLNENVTPYVTGAVQLKINQANLKRIPFVRATNEVCLVFAEYVQPLFAKIRANSEQNQTLAALRDTLLPKLISGELRVDNASEMLKEAVG